MWLIGVTGNRVAHGCDPEMSGSWVCSGTVWLMGVTTSQTAAETGNYSTSQKWCLILSVLLLFHYCVSSLAAETDPIVEKTNKQTKNNKKLGTEHRLLMFMSSQVFFEVISVRKRLTTARHGAMKGSFTCM